MSHLASVVSVGARSPYGLDATQTMMVWRAGRLSPRPLAWKDKRGREIGSVRTDAVPDEVHGGERLAELAWPALEEAMIGAGEKITAPPALFLATAESRPGMSDVANRTLLGEIAKRADVEIDLARSEVLAMGHAGFAIALERALAVLSTSRLSQVVVGGVDTYHQPETLAWLDASCRLHADEAPDGIIPSEGAAFLVLSARSGPALARVASAACALEEGHEEGLEPDFGRALQDVVRRATLGRQLPLKWLLTDANGERHRIRRNSFVRVREPGIISASDTEVLDSADEFGDAGAATGALLAVRVALSFASGATRFREALITLCSEGQERGAFVLEGAE